MIDYLLSHLKSFGWHLTVAEINKHLALQKIKGFEQTEAIDFDVENPMDVQAALEDMEIVISMLPARFHGLVAKSCAERGIHFLTASYATDEITSLSGQFRSKGKTAIMELGLDPGIDHMSAMRVLNRLKSSGHELTGFETFTGGLVADESVGDNPWKYKFTWNPRNVILAGQGTSRFIQEGRYKYIPYHRLFRRTELIYVPDHGYFEGYANRDSLLYLDIYGLQGIRTLYRGTLRRPGYCKAWDVFVQLGATDDSYKMKGVKDLTHRQFINSFLTYNPHDSVELKLAHYMNIEIDSEIMFRIRWLGLFSNELVGLEEGSPAQVLEHILKKKWQLKAEDKDQIIMWHKFNFKTNDEERQIESSMVVTGEDQHNTAMAKTVGLPLGIAAKNILLGKIHHPGVSLPISEDIYTPILEELKKYGIDFVEREVSTTKESEVV